MTNLPITNHLQTNIERSKKLAIELERNGVDLDILLYNLVSFPSLGMTNIITNCGIDANLFQEVIIKHVELKKPNKNCSDSLTKKVKDILLAAESLCKDTFELDYICPEVLFLCFFSEEFITKSMVEFFGDISVNEITNLPEIQKLFTLTALYINDIDFEQEQESDLFEKMMNEGNSSDRFLDMFEENPILSEFAENLNLKAAHGHFEQIVDFDGKINELASILCRKKKPNAILVGNGGVGKSSIVESLALMIIRGEAPELLANKVIYSLNLSSMVAGTMYRGQFEERLKNFVSEIKKYNNVILFIDEIHTLVGAGGGSSSSLEASNALKPELARGTISCIGATTINEYTDTIKKDSALDRRFERVLVREPSKFIMQKILPIIVSHYEDFHGVKYSEEFTNSVVDFCEKFLPNRFYPDKAVTVIDHCGAQAKVNFWEPNESIKESQKKILSEIEEDGEIPPALFEELNNKLSKWEEKLLHERPIVNVQHLKDFFEKKKNPLASFEVCQNIKKFIKQEFVGQKQAIKSLFTAINNKTLGLGKSGSNSNPDAYLFYGPNSCGKTLFSKIFKDALEKNGASVLYYSGNQLSDSYADYKIISDFGKNTTLCEKVIMDPNCVIIIDDIHLISSRCMALFSQILKDGKLQMNNGDIADFSNCKFIFTCASDKSVSMGFNSNKNNETPQIDAQFSSLMEKSIPFSRPSKKDLRRIVYKRLNSIKSDLFFQNITLRFNFKYIKNLVDLKFYNSENWQSLDFLVESNIIPNISEKISNGESKIELFD